MNGTKTGRIGSVDVTVLALISAFVLVIPSGALEASPLLKQDPCDALTQPCRSTTNQWEG